MTIMIPKMINSSVIETLTLSYDFTEVTVFCKFIYNPIVLKKKKMICVAKSVLKHL